MNEDQDTPETIRHKAREPEAIGFDLTDPDYPRPFQHDDGKPMTRLSTWMRKPSLSRMEAAYIIVGVDPRTVHNRFGRTVARALSGLIVQDPEIFDLATRLAPVLPADNITPAELARWARDNSHDDWLQAYHIEPVHRPIQESREDILYQWLADKGYHEDDLIAETKQEIWVGLSKRDSKLFPPSSPETLRDFFRNAGLKFRRGARPKSS